MCHDRQTAFRVKETSSNSQDTMRKFATACRSMLKRDALPNMLYAMMPSAVS